MKHAFLAPSSAYRWVKCPGSAILEKQQIDEETQASKEGTASHWVATETLRSWTSQSRIDESTFIDKIAPNGIIITDEMTQGAQEFVDAVLKVVQEHGLLSKLQIEQRVTLSPDNWGTPDTWVYDDNSGILYIWDYKYGHRFVDEYENWQLMNYALAILKGRNGLEDQHLRVSMCIIQPRCYSQLGIVRTWTVMASDLRGYANQLNTAAAEARRPCAISLTGSHCRYCKARYACIGAQKAAMAAIEISEEHAPMVVMPPDVLGLERQMLQRAYEALEFRITGLDARIINIIKSGTAVLGWGIKPTYGQQKWNKPYLEVAALGDLMDKDLRKPGVITPKQAIKLGIDKGVVNAYSETQQSGFKLVPDDNSKARKVFNYTGDNHD